MALDGDWLAEPGHNTHGRRWTVMYHFTCTALRVLVVLDDVDRPQPDELLVLFRAIRLLARFPGVYYLLA
jgi:hypothetical protein